MKRFQTGLDEMLLSEIKHVFRSQVMKTFEGDILRMQFLKEASCQGCSVCLCQQFSGIRK